MVDDISKFPNLLSIEYDVILVDRLHALLRTHFQVEVMKHGITVQCLKT